MTTGFRSYLRKCTLLLSSLFFLTSITAFADNKNYILATASTGGTFYPVGVAIATLSKVKIEPEHGFSLSAISSAGSGENIKLLAEDQAQFAILQGLYGAWAWKGEGRLEQSGKQTELRSISMLWQNVEHFSIRSSLVDSGTVEDLKRLERGKNKFSIGSKNSGTEGSGRQILTELNIATDKFNLAYMGYGASASALQNGVIDGMNTPAGVPVNAVTRALAALQDRLTVLDFTDEQLQQANREYPLWTRYVIPANTYPHQDKPINTIAQPNFLAVRADIPEEEVYTITKSLYDNLGYLGAIHKATSVMSIDKAIDGLAVPLHPGAARYFQEQGIEIPAHLIATP